MLAAAPPPASVPCGLARRGGASGVERSGGPGLWDHVAPAAPPGEQEDGQGAGGTRGSEREPALSSFGVSAKGSLGKGCARDRGGDDD